MTAIKPFKTSIPFIAMITLCFFFSCRNDNLELDIKFETPEKEYLKQLNNAAEKAIYKITIGDFQEKCYRKSYNINGKEYVFDLYLNSPGEVNSGSLRSYTYDIGTKKAKLFLNDTSSTYSYLSPVVSGISKVDFDNIKSFLDDKYGPGKENIETRKGFFNKLDTSYTYNYSNNDFNISLERNELYSLSQEEKKSLKIINPFSIGGTLTFESKNFNKLDKQEVAKRIKLLKPKDVLTFYWEEPYLESDTYGGMIMLKVNSERYVCDFLHKKIIQCKGDLIIKNAYGEVIKSGEIDYIFSSPLTPPWEVGNVTTPKAFTLTGNNLDVNKIRKMIKNHNRINVEFDIRAIAFEDGSTIRK